MPIVHGDREVIAVNDCSGVRRCATTYKVKRLLRREITSRYRTLDMGGTQAPPSAEYGQGLNKGWPCIVSDWIGRDCHG